MNSSKSNTSGAQKSALSLVALGAALLALTPMVVGQYWLTVANLFLINVILIVGYRFITTMGGWSFAHIAFMGIGAYTTAVLSTGENAWPVLFTIVAALAVSTVVALILSFPLLRTRSYYFFLSSFAAGEAIRQCFIQFPALTGGTNGIPFIPRPGDALFVDLSGATAYYYFTFVVACIVCLFLYLFDRSSHGKTVKAVALNEDLSKALGVDAWRYRSLAFVTGSVIASLGGSLFASFNGIINPTDFGSIVMFKLVAAAIVGGTRTFFGPVLGLLFLTILAEAFRNYGDWVPLLWGLSVIGALLFTKGGLDSLFFPGEDSGTEKR